jgi:hypothetical protein
MDLQEFTQKFLPNYDIRLSGYIVSYFRDRPIAFEKYGRITFCIENFPKTLQNFTELICEKQNERFNEGVISVIKDYRNLIASVLEIDCNTLDINPYK